MGLPTDMTAGNNVSDYRICTRCVMDSSDSKILFDEKGVCDHCHNFDTQISPNWKSGDEATAEITKLSTAIKHSQSNKDFDCIIGMSGGIDSSYLVYIAKEVMGLRPLVFHVDAGWNSPIAVNNIEKIVDGLGLDLYTEVINWNEMRDLQLAFFRSGVPHIDAPQDHAFFATMYSFAEKHGIKNILTGANLSTECIRNPIEWMYFQSDSRQLLGIHKAHGSIPLETFPTTSVLWHKLWLPYFRGIKVHKPLDLVPYGKEEAKKLLMDNFGWQPYPQKHFESRFTKFYESYWLTERFGYDVRRVQYSSLIMTGQLSRGEALEALESPPYDHREIDREKEFVSNKLNIEVEELEQYFRLPKKTFRDYPNQAALYDIGSTFLKKLGLEVGGKR